MRVVICGAGQVGFGIAERLSRENNDVSVIDTSARLVQAIRDRLDVRGVVGHGSHPASLVQAGIDQADMIVAVTLYDEVNMVACQIAHSLFNVPTKIARVRARSYLESQYATLFSRENLPIDVIISPEVEVGEMVLRRLALPGALDSARFAEDRISVVGIYLDEETPVIDTPLRQLSGLFPDLAATVVGVMRNDRMFVPRSDDAMLAGDIVYFAADRSQVRRTLGIFGREETEADRVVIAGGGNIGLYVAQALEMRQSRTKLKIIEQSRDRAIDIADDLSRCVVLHGNALDQEILNESDIARTDTLVALTNDDQVNILTCVMAKRLGARQNLALINNTSYPPLAQSLGIDAYVNPRQVTISRVLQHVRKGRIRQVHSLLDGVAEVIEAEALDTSPLVGAHLRDLDIPAGLRIGGILRGSEVIIPDGNTVVNAGDRVVIFALSGQVKQVEQLFRVSLEFF
ncbi:MAG: Trk system potassium transporter TrkA [Pseudomonadota bacterium]